MRICHMQSAYMPLCISRPEKLLQNCEIVSFQSGLTESPSSSRIRKKALIGICYRRRSRRTSSNWSSRRLQAKVANRIRELTSACLEIVSVDGADLGPLTTGDQAPVIGCGIDGLSRKCLLAFRMQQAEWVQGVTKTYIYWATVCLTSR